MELSSSLNTGYTIGKVIDSFIHKIIGAQVGGAEGAKCEPKVPDGWPSGIGCKIKHFWSPTGWQPISKESLASESVKSDSLRIFINFIIKFFSFILLLLVVIPLFPWIAIIYVSWRYVFKKYVLDIIVGPLEPGFYKKLLIALLVAIIIMLFVF